jgi:hypothetical protein
VFSTAYAQKVLRFAFSFLVEEHAVLPLWNHGEDEDDEEKDE